MPVSCPVHTADAGPDWLAKSYCSSTFRTSTFKAEDLDSAKTPVNLKASSSAPYRRFKSRCRMFDSTAPLTTKEEPSATKASICPPILSKVQSAATRLLISEHVSCAWNQMRQPNHQHGFHTCTACSLFRFRLWSRQFDMP